GEREKLEEVVLQDVPRRSGGVVEGGPTADADVLGHGDLHGVDEVRVPERLEQLVGEPQRHQILDGLLAQIVVDAEYVIGGEHTVDQLVELARTFQIVPEGLLDDNAAPATAARV